MLATAKDNLNATHSPGSATAIVDAYARVGLFASPPTERGSSIAGLEMSSGLKLVKRTGGKATPFAVSSAPPLGVHGMLDVATTLLPDNSFAFVDPQSARSAPTWDARVLQALAAAAHTAEENACKALIVMVGEECFETEVSDSDVFVRADLRRIWEKAGAHLVLPEREAPVAAALRESYEVRPLPALLLPASGSVLALEIEEPACNFLTRIKEKQQELRSCMPWRRTLLVNKRTARDAYSLIEISNAGTKADTSVVLADGCSLAYLLFCAQPTLSELAIEVYGLVTAGWSQLLFRRDPGEQVGTAMIGGRYRVTAFQPMSNVANTSLNRR